MICCTFLYKHFWTRHIQTNPTSCIFTPTRISLLPIFRLPPTLIPLPPQHRTVVVSVVAISAALAYLLHEIHLCHLRQVTQPVPLQTFQLITHPITITTVLPLVGKQPQLYRQSVVITVVILRVTYRQSLQLYSLLRLTITITTISTSTSCNILASTLVLVAIVATFIII